MTDKRILPEASAGKSRRKRATPTIDLTATEVPREAPKAASGAPPYDHAGEASPVAAATPKSEDSGSSAPRADAPEPELVAPAKAKDARKTRGFMLTAPALAAGIAGAAAMSLVMLALWLTGLVPIRYAGSTVLRARVAGLEMQLQDIQKRPPQAADSKTIDTLAQRIAKMEESLTKLPSANPALADRIAAADNAMKALGLTLTALNRRNDDIATDAAQARQRADAAEKAVADLRAGLQDVSKTASSGPSSADLAPLQQRIAALEQSAKTLQADVVKATASDKAARLALSAAALRDAVLRGAAFADELAQVQSLGADGKALAPLTPFATQGVPDEKALAQELSALLPAMIKAAGAPAASGGFIERLQANAEQLVRVRPVDAPVGDDAGAVLSRIEVAAARADIAAALGDLGKLPAAQSAAAQAWIGKAANRQAAIAAARQLAADTARSLGSR